MCLMCCQAADVAAAVPHSNVVILPERVIPAKDVTKDWLLGAMLSAHVSIPVECEGHSIIFIVILITLIAVEFVFNS